MTCTVYIPLFCCYRSAVLSTNACDVRVILTSQQKQLVPHSHALLCRSNEFLQKENNSLEKIFYAFHAYNYSTNSAKLKLVQIFPDVQYLLVLK